MVPGLPLALIALAVAPASIPTPTTRPPATPAFSSLVSFGSSIAFSGDELLVGRPGTVANFPMPPSQGGAVYVFRKAPGGGWAEAATLAPADGKVGDGFGAALAASGGLLAVSAPNASDGRGAVYVFERSTSGWREAAKLLAAESAAGDGFGSALSVEMGLVVAGAPGRDSARGAVYAFRRDAEGRWSPGLRVAAGATPNDRFGAALAFAGDRLVVGAPGPSPLGGPFGGGQRPRVGGVTVYRPAGPDRWAEEGGLGVAADSVRLFGAALAHAGSSLFASAPLANQGRGAVYEFQRDEAGEWKLLGSVSPESPGGFFGAALAASGDALIVGAPFANQAKGEIYAYRRDATGWSTGQKLAVAAAGMLIAYGSAIAVQGTEAVVGGPGADFFEGLGFVYGRDPSGQWTARGTLSDRPTSLPAITGRERRCEGPDIAGFACRNVDLLSFLPVSQIGGKRGIMLNDIWGWTHAPSGREFALVGRMDGSSFVEVTDPANPVYLGDLPLHRGAHPNMWRDMKVYKDHVFIVADGAGPHGIQIFDLTQLLGVSSPPVTFQETAHYDRIASAHNIAINEETGFAYPIGNSMGGETCGGALHMVDIRDPRNPKFAGCYADKSTGNARTGYTHDAQCVTYQGPDARYAGREICFNASETAVGIADVTDKASPKPLAVAAYPNTAYAHQGWLSEDQRYFFLDDEGDELSGTVPRTRTIVWDVSKLDEPVLLTEFLGTNSASDHNLYVRGNYMFQSNYVSGLRVVDISDPKNPREVGYLDTVPFGENVPGFAGSWSNYPYFKSGTIVLTSMREGLFVVRHRPERPIP
jgi:choice-of-anchor B domain-containing protein